CSSTTRSAPSSARIIAKTSARERFRLRRSTQTDSTSVTRLTNAGSPRVRSSKNQDRKSTRLNSSHVKISYAVFCLKKKKNGPRARPHRGAHGRRGTAAGGNGAGETQHSHHDADRPAPARRPSGGPAAWRRRRAHNH